MSALVASIMLICAVLVSLALGVLMAYAICQAMFGVFRGQSIAAAKRRAQRAASVGVVPVVVEG